MLVVQCNCVFLLAYVQVFGADAADSLGVSMALDYGHFQSAVAVLAFALRASVCAPEAKEK